MSTNWIPLQTTLQKHDTITTLKPAEPEAISSKMDKVTIDPRLLLLILQWFRALLSTTQHRSLHIPLTPACGAHSGETPAMWRNYFSCAESSLVQKQREQESGKIRETRAEWPCVSGVVESGATSVFTGRGLSSVCHWKNQTYFITLKCKMCVSSVWKCASGLTEVQMCDLRMFTMKFFLNSFFNTNG